MVSDSQIFPNLLGRFLTERGIHLSFYRFYMSFSGAGRRRIISIEDRWGWKMEKRDNRCRSCTIADDKTNFRLRAGGRYVEEDVDPNVFEPDDKRPGFFCAC